jgi:choline dehydrogenase-like flavoprotein
MAADAAAVLSQEWDVVVIGTGVGGATLGYALAIRGLRILFIEKGGVVAAKEELAAALTPEARLLQGWWPQLVSQRRPDGRCDRFYAPIGCALGGSSIHYAAALERMDPSDFETLLTSRQQVPAWPVSYDEFVPFYEAAELIYRIGPDSDPDGDARLSEWDLALMDAMRRNGLKPERLHIAIRYDRDCQECLGRICPRRCKADSRTVCLEKALRQPRCQVLDHCEVLTLEADSSRVQVIHALHRSDPIELRARVVVLAAGALHSPQILLRSRNSFWPNGLANRSDQVGRNLMFHTADMYALWAPRRFDRRGRQQKSLSVKDFYIRDGVRLGHVQSMGMGAGRGHIAGYLKDTLRRRGLRSELLLSLLAKLPSHLAAWLLGEASIFFGMTEDDPDPDNRIQLDPREPDGAAFTYTITTDLHDRATALRKVFAHHVKPWRLARLSPTLTMNYGHPSGTCRFGDDENRSVLNRNCRTHDVDNLYVVDASFMPRSGAINPSLTIAANALRVANRIAAVVSAP